MRQVGSFKSIQIFHSFLPQGGSICNPASHGCCVAGTFLIYLPKPMRQLRMDVREESPSPMRRVWEGRRRGKALTYAAGGEEMKERKDPYPCCGWERKKERKGPYLCVRWGPKGVVTRGWRLSWGGVGPHDPTGKSLHPCGGWGKDEGDERPPLMRRVGERRKSGKASTQRQLGNRRRGKTPKYAAGGGGWIGRASTMR